MDEPVLLSLVERIDDVNVYKHLWSTELERVQSIERELRRIYASLAYVRSSDIKYEKEEAARETATEVATELADRITSFVRKASTQSRRRSHGQGMMQIILPFQLTVSILVDAIERFKLTKALRKIEKRLLPYSIPFDFDFLAYNDFHTLERREGRTVSEKLNAMLKKEIWIFLIGLHDDIEKIRDGLAHILDMVQEIELVEERLLDKRKKAWLQLIEVITNSIEKLFPDLKVEACSGITHGSIWLINTWILEACEAYSLYGIGPEFETESVRQWPRTCSIRTMHPAVMLRKTILLPFTRIQRHLMIMSICFGGYQYAHGILTKHEGGQNIFIYSKAELEFDFLRRDLSLKAESFEHEFDFIGRELRLMKAFFEDLEAIEDLDADERMKVWKEEMKGIAYSVEALHKRVDAAIRTQNEAVKFKRERRNIIRKLKHIKVEIHELSQLKKTYDIGSSKAGKRSEPIASALSLRPKTESSIISESTSEISGVAGTSSQEEEERRIEINDSTILDERGVSPSNLFDEDYSIHRELKLMHAFCEDVETMEKPDARLKVWAEELKAVVRESEDMIRPYVQNNQILKGGTFNFKRWMAFKSIKRWIYYLTEWKETYDITYDLGGMKRRKAPHRGIQNLQETRPSTSGTSSNLEEPLLAPRHQTIERRRIIELHLYDVMTILLFRNREKVRAWPVEVIRRQLEMMHALFEDVEAMGDVDEKVKVWVEEMRDVVANAEKLIDACDSNENTRGGRIQKYFYMFNVCHLFGTRSRSIAEDIDRIWADIGVHSARRMAYGIENIRSKEEPRSMGKRPLSSSEDNKPNDGIIGFDKDIEEVMKQLLNNERPLCIFTITGAGGSGKTTLAKLIYTNDKIQDHFVCQAWVSVSDKEFNPIAILQAIVKQFLGLRELTDGEKELTQMLKGFLKDRRYLIVLDNIQPRTVWGRLHQAFPDASNRSRVIFTTRDGDVARPNGYIHRMHLLNEVESWTLLQNTLNREISNPHMAKVGKEIASRCRGSPQELVKIGEILSEKQTLSEWRTVLKQQQAQFNREPGYHLRRYMFYFLLFPIDYEIPVRRLIALWVADDIVQQKEDKKEPAEYVAERHLTELIDRDLVQVKKKKLTGKFKACRLPEEQRELCLAEAKKANFIQWPVSESSDSSSGACMIRRLVDDPTKKDDSHGHNHIHGNDRNISLSFKDCYKDVISFHSFDTREESKSGQDIRNFLHKYILDRCFLLLRVLDLEQVFRPKLPKVIKHLTHLRYLGLRWTYLQELPPYVSDLLNLQVLDLKHTYISTLPKSIWDMQYLRHLYMSETYRSKFDHPPSGRCLIELQTLWGAFIDEKSPVKNSLDRSLDIRKLGLTCRITSPCQQAQMSSQLDTVANWIRQLEHLRTLRLKSYGENGDPGDLHLKHLFGHRDLSTIYLLGRLKHPTLISRIPESLTEIKLSASALTLDPMKTLGKLPKLKILWLLAESYIETDMHCSSRSFPRLQVLQLWKLQQLEQWVVEIGALPALQDLEIRCCKNLKKLPDGLRHLRTLQKLTLGSMPDEFARSIKINQPQLWRNIAHTLKIDNPVEQC